MTDSEIIKYINSIDLGKKLGVLIAPGVPANRRIVIPDEVYLGVDNNADAISDYLEALFSVAAVALEKLDADGVHVLHSAELKWYNPPHSGLSQGTILLYMTAP